MKYLLLLRLSRPIWHLITIVIVFLFSYNLRTITDGIPFIHLKIPLINLQETVIFVFISAILFPLIWLTKNLYKLKWPIHNYYNKFIKVFIFWFVSITFLAYFWNWFLFINWISRLILIWWWLFSFLWLIFVDFIFNIMNTYFEKKSPYKIWVFKTKYFSKIKKKFNNYDIYKLNEFNELDNIDKFDIIFLVWNVNTWKVEEIMDIARIKQIEIFHIPDVNFLEDILYHSERIWALITWRYKPSPLEWRWKVFKRIFDIMFSLCFIICFWWIYVIIALRIYFHDKWNIFYVSKRIGQGWKEIKIYKFRTMIQNADNLKKQLLDKNERDDILFKIQDDPRIKPWWKILRKTSLDEIPQFFNVLLWTMSIAWPRPHLKEEIDKYKKWQKRLLATKPWITGYAQVFGRDLPFDEEARLDLYRFQNWSIWMDIIVILWVFKTLFKGE